MIRHIRISLSRFRADLSGATAVEFAILMPVMMVVFGAVVEGSRIYWNYQSAVSGVRDAARYLARITDADICNGIASETAQTLPGGASGRATNIIARNVGNGSTNLFPPAVTVTSVQATYTCPDLNLRTDPTPLAQVQATLNIQMPFGAVFEFFGARQNATLQSVITDQSRIYGI